MSILVFHFSVKARFLAYQNQERTTTTTTATIMTTTLTTKPHTDFDDHEIIAAYN